MRQRFTEFVMANQGLALEEPALSHIQSEGFGYNESVVLKQSFRRKLDPNASQYSHQQSRTKSAGQRGRKNAHETSMQFEQTGSVKD
jgi:hypothetical protein